MLYILADDLTGANDTGVKLRNKGYNTEIYFNNIKKHINKNNNNIAIIDTETRELSKIEAGNKTRNVLDNIELEDKDIIYKKIDSTLRGNIGVEIKELLKKFEYSFCLFSPAFPENKRIVVGGNLLVDNVPLGLSEYKISNSNIGEATYIKNILQKQIDCKIENIELKTVLNGQDSLLKRINYFAKEKAKIIIIDAIRKKDLKNIIKVSKKIPDKVLYCGSAGLANYLDDLIDFPTDNKVIDYKIFNKNLFVCGSKRTILNEQINYLLENNKDVKEIKIDLKRIIYYKEQYLSSMKSELIKQFNINKNIIVRLDPTYNNIKCINHIKKTNNLSNRDLEEKIKEYLGLLTKTLIGNNNNINIIVTGGDTAFELCKQLKIDHLKTVKELLPGVPFTIGCSEKFGKLNFVTKAGGFGGKKVFYNILKKIDI